MGVDMKVKAIYDSEIGNITRTDKNWKDAEYKKALDNLNDRMCRELGLYYDSNYNLVIKKDNSK